MDLKKQISETIRLKIKPLIEGDYHFYYKFHIV